MLLNDVVLGKGIKLTTNNESLTQVRRCLSPGTLLHSEPQQPPSGYDSVIGEPGGNLNYDECIGTRKQLAVLVAYADAYTVYKVSGHRCAH